MMFKVAVSFLFLSVVYCANVYRQMEQDIENPFLRYRYTDGNQEMSDREWQRRREIERRYQRQRQRAINQQIERLAELFEGDYEEIELERYDRYREQQRWRARVEGEYEPVYEVQPYWTSYDSQAYSLENLAMSFLFS